jgi:citronellol/citronellal dehydrogenase
VTIVTGGGSDIGRCIAHEVAALGAKVALFGRNPEKLEKVSAEIADAGGIARGLSCDIRDEVAVAAAVEAVLAKWGCIDGLVNNAGGQYAAPIADLSYKGWDAVMRNNLTGGFLVTQQCFKQWMAEHGGAIVNIIADMWHGMPGMAHSGAARAGMLNFTETAAAEWGMYGIRVNAVAPGWIASSGFDTYPPEVAKFFLRLHRAVPLQRLGTESETSAAVVFLLTPATAFISGSCIRVDGAAPNAKVASPWTSIMVANGEISHSEESTDPPWPLPDKCHSEPWNGFHLAELPRLLKDGIAATAKSGSEPKS